MCEVIQFSQIRRAKDSKAPLKFKENQGFLLFYFFEV